MGETRNGGDVDRASSGVAFLPVGPRFAERPRVQSRKHLLALRFDAWEGAVKKPFLDQSLCPEAGG